MLEDHDLAETIGMDDDHLLGKWTRIYLHGVIAFVAIGAIGYVASLLLPVFDFTGNRLLAIALATTVIIVGPPVVGSIILYGLFPWLGKRDSMRGLLAWDDRLLSEVTSAKEKARIVIINWPTDNVRTMGVLTSTFASQNSEKQLAAVYVPTAPQTKFGYIRIVELDDVEFTDWTFKQWQLYQFTFGSVSPDRLDEVSDQ
jgi:uncharacterized membrane protein